MSPARQQQHPAPFPNPPTAPQKDERVASSAAPLRVAGVARITTIAGPLPDTEGGAIPSPPPDSCERHFPGPCTPAVLANPSRPACQMPRSRRRISRSGRWRWRPAPLGRCPPPPPPKQSGYVVVSSSCVRRCSLAHPSGSALPDAVLLQWRSLHDWRHGAHKPCGGQGAGRCGRADCGGRRGRGGAAAASGRSNYMIATTVYNCALQFTSNCVIGHL